MATTLDNQSLTGILVGVIIGLVVGFAVAQMYAETYVAVRHMTPAQMRAADYDAFNVMQRLDAYNKRSVSRIAGGRGGETHRALSGVPAVDAAVTQGHAAAGLGCGRRGDLACPSYLAPILIPGIDINAEDLPEALLRN